MIIGNTQSDFTDYLWARNPVAYCIKLRNDLLCRWEQLAACFIQFNAAPAAAAGF